MRLFDAAYEADSSGPGRGCVERAGGRCVVSQPKLQLQLEFNVNNCLQLHLFICTPFAQLPHLPPASLAPHCTISLMVLSPVAAVDDAMMMMPLTVPVPVPDSWPLVLAGDHVDWFRFDSHFMRPGHVYYFISFHFI